MRDNEKGRDFRVMTNFNYEYEASNNKAVRFMLPGNVVQKYKQYDNNTKQILKSTEKCPFTQIRELIIAFKSNDFKVSQDIELPDILRQKYEQNKKQQTTDQQLCTKISQIQALDIRSNIMKRCLQTYQQYASNYTKNVDTNVDRSQIQTEYSQMVAKNTEFLQRQNQYFLFLTYSHELQRALVLAAIQNIQLMKPANNAEINRVDITNFQQFIHQLDKKTQKLPQNYDKLLQFLFDWRQYVKNGQVSNEKMGQFMSGKSAIQSQTNTNVKQARQLYKSLSQFARWFENDRRNYRDQYQSKSRKYKAFLGQYTKTKQKYQMHTKKSYYRQLIRTEKQRLENHLKKNYGMIVNYIPSEQYIKTIQVIQSKQLKSILSDELDSLQSGIKYINSQYQPLYKQVCESSQYESGKVRKKIEQNLKKFQGYSDKADQHNQFSIHLIQSCRKLLRIAK